MGIIEKLNLMSDKNELKKLNTIVDQIENFEETIQKLTDEELKNKTEEFKQKLKEGKTLDDILPEAFAVVREVSKRVLSMRQYRVQLIGGIVLHQAKIAEMKTGEGKTLVAVAPVYLNALEGKGVHVVTVNDYLAKRDKEIMEPVYDFLGLSVGVILHGQDTIERKEQYMCDITYGTNNEFGFDYLKDNMVSNKEEILQRGLHYAIVDEVDSILIDEARTPLIISGQIHLEEKAFRMANVFIKMLLKPDYTYKEKERTVYLTETGIKKAEMFFHLENLMDAKNIEIYHYIIQALTADTMMQRDVDYIVKDGNIEIVDTFTGRVMEGRRFSEGLHQAIEAKENVEIKNESKTLATITYQNLFRMYKKLSGMTGTAKTEEQEFESTYRMNVVQIPTNKPVIRKELETKIFKSEIEKYRQILDDIKAIHETGQPVLIGTASIVKSEVISHLLNSMGIEHNLLNAKNHEKEANIIKDAGQKNAVTVATNMAGRGTDIALGEGVEELGGLYVIGTEKHENRRIDNQLKGRSARQGDPGVSRFYVSLEDDLVRLYGSKKLEKISDKLQEQGQVEHKSLDKLIEDAQISLESKNFGIRKEVLKYDEAMNKQRNLIYRDRNKVLFEEDIDAVIGDMVDVLVDNIYTSNSEDEFIEEVRDVFGVEVEKVSGVSLLDSAKEMIREIDLDEISFKKSLVLSVVDKYWVEHLDLCEQVKKVVPLQAIGQKDPLKEYTIEVFAMFDEMSEKINRDVVCHIYRK